MLESSRQSPVSFPAPEPMDRETRIMNALRQHHADVARIYNPVMTVLVGSQNYGLDTEQSDFDTCTFILPPVRDIARLYNPVSLQQEDSLGHIVIKDIRLGLKLLKQTSPNSVEWFASKYRIVEPQYEDLLQIPPVVLRCNTRNMMNAIVGMSHQLSERNMSAGKRLSHMLRLECMIFNYFSIHSDLLALNDEEHKLAMKAKLDPDNPAWNDLADQHAAIIQDAARNVDYDYFIKTESYAYGFLTDLQVKFVALAVTGCVHKTQGRKEKNHENPV